MFCAVHPLRESGGWLSIHTIVDRGPVLGCLYFGPIEKGMRERFGHDARIARLTSLRTPGRVIGHELHWARAIVAKEGGLMIEGIELRARGLKSSPVKTKQTWWCMFEVERAYAAMLKMNVQSATGFHVNDDDRDD